MFSERLKMLNPICYARLDVKLFAKYVHVSATRPKETKRATNFAQPNSNYYFSHSIIIIIITVAVAAITGN